MSEKIALSLKGITHHALMLNINKINGPIKNKKEDALIGIGFSFKTNLKASAIGCKRPKNPVTLGPFLFCILPKTLRSNKVKKATAKITFIII